MRAGQSYSASRPLPQRPPRAARAHRTRRGERGDHRGNVTLTLTAITDAKPAWEELIAAYKKVEPDVTIKASYAPTDQLQTSLRAQLGAGNAPDLYVV